MKLETPADGPGFWIAVLVLMALLSVSGCQEDTPTSCPSYAVGTVQGYLLSVGQGVSMDIRARSVEGSNWGEIVASTTSDSRGWYRFDTPSGLYRLEVKPDDEHSFSYDPRDTVRVRKKVRRYDLWKCRIEVQVGVPDEMEGQVFQGMGGQKEWMERRKKEPRYRLIAGLADILPALTRLSLVGLLLSRAPLRFTGHSPV